VDIEVKMPDIGVDEVEVIEILVKINDKVEYEQGLITVEGDKASMDIPSPKSGFIKHIYVKIGDKVKTSSVLMVLNILEKLNHNDQNVLKKDKNSLDQEVIKDLNYLKNNFVHATPVVRRLARDLKIKLDDVIPTGRKHRILREDVEAYAKILNCNNKENNVIQANISDILTIKEIDLTNIQKKTGINLQKNWKNIPHVTQFDEVDITILEKFRKKYNFENNNLHQKSHNVTILIFILKVVACALKRFPIFNSSFSENNHKIILKKYINIGVAVDIKDGLVVPVLKNVDQKNIKQLSLELIALSEKARQKKLNKSDISEGSFTISNLGGIGGGWFSPIINAPEVAILGISKSIIKPLWNGTEFIPSLMLPLSLSYDHRVINGADAARFITFIGKLLSDMHFLIM